MSEDQAQRLYERLKKDAGDAGYRLNPDASFAMELIRGLLTNEGRYGYWACPCRLASGDKAEDLDIICPCDYRDDDLNEYGACFCALYVSEAIAAGEQPARSIPDRRTLKKEERKETASAMPPPAATLAYPVWRCKVCGYLCAREAPPGVCPICKAQKERFERFL